MELKHIKSRIGTKYVHKKQVIGIPISSTEYDFLYKSSRPDQAASQYQLMPSPSKHSSKIRHSDNAGGVISVITKMIKIGENVDIFVQGIRNRVNLGRKLSETVKGKLSLGAKILQVGGVDKVFKRKFNIRDNNEKLLKASQCYLSTTAGPIAGLLFISNNRIEFCIERSIKVTSPTGKLLKVHYKVMIPLGKIKRAVETENSTKEPTQKQSIDELASYTVRNMFKSGKKTRLVVLIVHVYEATTDKHKWPQSMGSRYSFPSAA